VVMMPILVSCGTGVDVAIVSGVGRGAWLAAEVDESPLSKIRNHNASTTAMASNARRSPSTVRLACGNARSFIVGGRMLLSSSLGTL